MSNGDEEIIDEEIIDKQINRRKNQKVESVRFFCHRLAQIKRIKKETNR